MLQGGANLLEVRRCALSFKDADETPDQRKKREYSENPNNFDPIRPKYCQACGCTYRMGCTQHPSDVQVSLVKTTPAPATKK